MKQINRRMLTSKKLNLLNGIKKVLLLTLIATLSLTMHADGIKTRLAKRLPEINKMKAASLVGENSKGYLEAKASLSKESKQILEDENIDRKKIYKFLAKKTNESLATIEKRRALTIAKKTKKGYWIQAKDGAWHKK